MNVGLVSLFAFRPNIEHTVFLDRLLKLDGHKTFHMTCEGALKSCFVRQLPTKGDKSECLKCRLGGIRSFINDEVEVLEQIDVKSANPTQSRASVSSSVATILRIENAEEATSEHFKNVVDELVPNYDVTKENVTRWIKRKKIDCLFIFNGRLDITRAAMDAAKELGVGFVCHDKSWLGDGLHAVPGDNVLGLKNIDRVVKYYDDMPLQSDQSEFVLSLMARRQKKYKNVAETIVYNVNSAHVEWPIEGNKPRVLILPGSKCEYFGHQDWQSSWTNNIDALVDFFELHPDLGANAVLRCHPGWATSIFGAVGKTSIELYTNWCHQNDIHIIDSDNNADTFSLIEQADIIIVNGSSAAMEAGLLGKYVVLLGHAPYQMASFVNACSSKSDIAKLNFDNINPTEITRSAFRYIYTRTKRLNYFSEHIISKSALNAEYNDGADISYLLNSALKNEIIIENTRIADNTSEEDVIIGQLKQNGLAHFLESENSIQEAKKIEVKRRFMYRPITFIRNIGKAGNN